MKIKSIIMSVLMCVTLASCQAIDSKNNRIDLIELFEENGDIVKEACSYRDYSYLINSEEYRDSTIEVKIENRSTLGFFNYLSCTNQYNQKIFFKNALTVNYPTEKTIYALEMRNEQKAIQVFNQMDKNIYSIEWKQEKNIIYFDSYIYHLLLGNYIKDGNNFLTIDGKGILTNLSKDSIINIPDVEEIKPDAFRLHRNIKLVFLNENLVIIGYGAFINCSNLEKVFFNNALKRISEAAFFNSGLKNVVIPDGVEYIGEKAFGYCLKLKYVVVPDSVEYIGENAFTNGKIYCESLSKPEGWDDNFISNKAVVLWGNEWEYDENGEPRAK